MIFGREPAVFLGMIAAILSVATGFGLDLTMEQHALLMGAVNAVVAFAVRQSVTPISH